MWDLIVSVPGHCLSFYFVSNSALFRVALEFALVCIWVNKFSPYVFQ